MGFVQVENARILVMTSAYARPLRLSGWRWERKTASGDGSVRAIFLGGKSRGSVASGILRFSGRFLRGFYAQSKPV